MTMRTDRKTATQRAAIYARVSDKSQDTEEKTSISEQISDMETHCQRRGLTITARYQEVGRGWSKNRPEFQRMLADAKRGRFDTIVCWKSDRLSRGMYPAAALMEVIEAYQIDLEAVMDAIDMKTFGLMAAIGKIELDNFRERASMGKRGSAKQGRIPVNNVPFGYRLGEGRRPEIVEADAEVIRRVFHMYVRKGMGARLIAKQLTAEGVPTPRAVGKWLDGTVTRILRHESYRGTWWFGKVRHVATEHGTRRYGRPEDEWVEVPFPRIVDDEIWEQAQEGQEAPSDPLGPQHQALLSLAAPGQVRRVRVSHGLPGQQTPGYQAQRQVLYLRAGHSPTLLQLLRNDERGRQVPGAPLHQGGTA